MTVSDIGRPVSKQHLKADFLGFWFYFTGSLADTSVTP